MRRCAPRRVVDAARGARRMFRGESLGKSPFAGRDGSIRSREKNRTRSRRNRKILDTNLLSSSRPAFLWLSVYTSSNATTRRCSVTSTLNVRQAAPVSMASNPMPARKNWAPNSAAGNTWRTPGADQHELGRERHDVGRVRGRQLAGVADRGTGRDRRGTDDEGMPECFVIDLDLARCVGADQISGGTRVLGEAHKPVRYLSFASGSPFSTERRTPRPSGVHDVKQSLLQMLQARAALVAVFLDGEIRTKHCLASTHSGNFRIESWRSRFSTRFAPCA
jgi:hypothetical protein